MSALRDRLVARSMSPSCTEFHESIHRPSASGAPSPSRAGGIGLAVVFVYLLATFACSINLPWVEEDNYTGALYAQAAHNNLRAGLRVTAGVPATLYCGPLPIPTDEFYVHHPTLLPLLVTGAFAIFGEHEWSARLVPIAGSLASVLLLWLLVGQAAGPRAATCAAAVFAVLPMELHYGDMVDFEPCLVALMLAALCCLQRWAATAKVRWAGLAAACCQLALWMDWPGYLFVLSLVGWLFWKRATRWLAWLLLALVAASGALFLLQIRWVNPTAWSDLWAALMLRIGNGADPGSDPTAASGRHFTAVEWCVTVGRYVVQNFQPVPLALAVAGAALLFARRRTAPGLRGLGRAVRPMLIAAVLYIVIFRSESFIHDFAPFYLIGVIAILAGVALDAALDFASRKAPTFRRSAQLGLVALLVTLALLGRAKAQAMRSQFLILYGETPEPAHLVPALGRRLQDTFAPDTTILLNFDPYDSNLPYYTQRTILNNLNAASDWKTCMAQESPVGGVIWRDAPGAAAILAALPPGEITNLEVAGHRFALWVPPPARAKAR